MLNALMETFFKTITLRQIRKLINGINLVRINYTNVF